MGCRNVRVLEELLRVLLQGWVREIRQLVCWQARDPWRGQGEVLGVDLVDVPGALPLQAAQVGAADPAA